MSHKNWIMWGMVLAVTLLQVSAFAGDKKAASPKAAPAILPNVLIIGDSISIGYTKTVRGLLEGKANVSRPRTNCGPSDRGVAGIERWVGKTKWDVIHFNFGIWDTHYLHNGKLVRDRSKYKAEDLKRRNSTAEYVDNLSKIIAVMKPTGAKLIWASTTPYVSYGEDTKLLVAKNNKAAKELMDKEGVTVNDLHMLALPNLKEWQSGDGCHFNRQGYQHLAKQVASSISEALSKKAKDSKPAIDNQ